MFPLLVLFLFLQGCASPAIDQSYSSRQEIVQNLLDEGVYFAQHGEKMSFYIPIERLFVPYTSQWKSNAQDYLLHSVSDFISTYDVVEVNVSSKLFGAKNKNYLNAIGQQQANLVANMLSRYNLDVRLLSIMKTKKSSSLPAKIKALKNNTVIDSYGYIVIDFKFNRKFF